MLSTGMGIVVQNFSTTRNPFIYKGFSKIGTNLFGGVERKIHIEIFITIRKMQVLRIVMGIICAVIGMMLVNKFYQPIADRITEKFKKKRENN